MPKFELLYTYIVTLLMTSSRHAHSLVARVVLTVDAEHEAGRLTLVNALKDQPRVDALERLQRKDGSVTSTIQDTTHHRHSTSHRHCFKISL